MSNKDKKLFWLIMVMLFFLLLVGGILPSLVYAQTATVTPWQTPIPITKMPVNLSTPTAICPVGGVQYNAVSGFDYMMKCSSCVTGVPSNSEPTQMIRTIEGGWSTGTPNTTIMPIWGGGTMEPYQGEPDYYVVEVATKYFNINNTWMGVTHDEWEEYCEGGDLLAISIGSDGCCNTQTMRLSESSNGTGARICTGWPNPYKPYDVLLAHNITLADAKNELATGETYEWEYTPQTLSLYTYVTSSNTLRFQDIKLLCYGVQEAGSTATPTPSGVCGQTDAKVSVLVNDGIDETLLQATDGNFLNYDRINNDINTPLTVEFIINKDDVTFIRAGDFEETYAVVYDCDGNIIHNNYFGYMLDVGWDFSPTCIDRVRFTGVPNAETKWYLDSVISDGCSREVNDCTNTTVRKIAELPYLAYDHRECYTLLPEVAINTTWLETLFTGTDVEVPDSVGWDSINVCLKVFRFVDPKILGFTIPVITIIMVYLAFGAVRKIASK